MKKLLTIILTALCLTATAQPFRSMVFAPPPDSPVSRGRATPKHMLREARTEFFTTDEARRIGDQVLLWQRCTGGWPKNVDMVTPMSTEQQKQVALDKQRKDDSTTDNNATTMQIKYLARLYQATRDARYRDAFRHGVEYLLSGQYKDGGWPQFWPNPRGYQVHITYNDDAMTNTMELLRDISEGQEPYGGDLCTKAQRKRMKKAFDKGIECILATQIRTDKAGKVLPPKQPAPGAILTVWCQQHYRDTYLPAPARAYELPSYCSQESAWIVRLLMQLPNPDQRVKAAIHGAMAWFDKYKLTGLKIVRTRSADGKKMDTKLIPSANAAPLWSRYYDLDSCTPYVSDRDGVPRRSLEEIGEERRNGYSWYNDRPAELYELYDQWAAKHDPSHKVSISLSTKGANENGTIDYNVAS